MSRKEEKDCEYLRIPVSRIEDVGRGGGEVGARGTMNCYKYNYQVPDIIPTGGGQARHVVVMADPTRTDLWWGESKLEG